MEGDYWGVGVRVGIYRDREGQLVEEGLAGGVVLWGLELFVEGVGHIIHNIKLNAEVQMLIF